MAFIRRFYYIKSTGAMLSSFMMDGSFVPHGQDWDYLYDGALLPYADRRGEVGCFEWTEKDPEVEREFAESYGQSVDVSVTPHRLVFDYTPPPPAPPQPTPEETYQAGADAILGMLGIGGTTNV